MIDAEFTAYVNRRIDRELASHAVAFRSLAAHEVVPRRIVELSGERFAQIYSSGGDVIASTRYLGAQRLLNAAQLRAAARGPVQADRVPTAPTQEGVRLRGFVISEEQIAVVAESRDDPLLEIRELGALLALGLGGALVLASFAGYRVAGAALRPVERMRARAATIGHGDLERLPAPGTRDELDRLADTLNELLDRVQGALEHERRMVGNASHELRTPISVLRTRLDVALRGSGDAASLRAVLEEASADTGRLSRLADDLLVLARADQGGLPLRPEPLEVQDLLERAAARHQSTAKRAGRELLTSVEIEGGAVLLGDPDRLGQVLDNLIVNSLRYGAGPIELSARPTDVAGRIELVVRDHGSGFPQDFLGRAFDRFSQAREGHGEGSGLGLAIVDAVVRAHHGTAIVGNHGKGGAEVRLQLPLA